MSAPEGGATSPAALGPLITGYMPARVVHSVPAPADAYVLKYVIHDWDDEQSVAILRNCRKAMHETSGILVIERVMPERIEAMPIHLRIAMGDMNMMAMPGGRERTEQEYRNLSSQPPVSHSSEPPRCQDRKSA
jgi:hypothetical protein